MSISPYLPKLKALPVLSDASVTTIRSLSNLPKALPGMPDGSSGTNARAAEAAIFLRDMGLSFEVSKAREARMKAISRMKNKAADRMAKSFGLAKA
tara:strand:- start:572 stop:859 length:288 start_codon:yes stop_codon:yes gene_type:complete